LPEKEFEELQTIKKLIIILLGKLGSASPEIADALKIDDSTVRSWVSLGKVKKIKGV
jgi:DNA-directed RNA polymerase specialized sigma24 family protein